LSDVPIRSESSDLDRIIILALERISLVFRNLLWEHSKKEGLSPIQIQFLLFIYSHSRQYSSVSEIARTFNLTAATVSDAVAALERKGLVQKLVSRRDKRMYPLALTRSGRQMSLTLMNWYQPLLPYLQQFTEQSREQSMRFLLQLLNALQPDETRETIKTCLFCGHFREKNSDQEPLSPYCILRNVPLNEGEFRLNCAEFQQADLM
jgi:DNA-binding MarR family transcriptional regulator